MSQMKKTAIPRLCYIDGCWAYFTTQPLDQQWGDDWNDTPYEHNAGVPYEPRKDEPNPWEIIKVAWDGDFLAPCDSGANSYSVEQINNGALAWLRASRWRPALFRFEEIVIPAGTALDNFKSLIQLGGGNVYVREEA